MKKLLYLFPALAVVCIGATIQWYSQQPVVTALLDTDVIAVERATPQAYKSATLATLKSYMDDTGPNIATFTSDAATNEIGSTVAATHLSWTLSGSTPTSQSINQGIGAIAVGTLTATYGTPLTANLTFTLTVANAQGSDTATTTVRFMQKVYWGHDSETSLDDADIIALSSEFSQTRLRTKTITCAGEYMYFAYPASYGAATFVVNGLLNTAWGLTTRNFVNASGATESYRVYRSDNLLTGTYIVEIQ